MYYVLLSQRTDSSLNVRVVIYSLLLFYADVHGVVRVIPHRFLNLHTTRSWNFLQVDSHIRNGIQSRSQSGIGSIIGVMDTG